MQDKQTVLLRYKRIAPLRWVHVESLADDGRELTEGRVEPNAGATPLMLTVRATISDEVRTYLCAWELYDTTPDCVPLARLAEFDIAWRRLRIDYNQDGDGSGGRVYWDRQSKAMSVPQPKRKRGRPPKNRSVVEADSVTVHTN